MSETERCDFELFKRDDNALINWKQYLLPIADTIDVGVYALEQQGLLALQTPNFFTSRSIILRKQVFGFWKVELIS